MRAYVRTYDGGRRENVNNFSEENRQQQQQQQQPYRGRRHSFLLVSLGWEEEGDSERENDFVSPHSFLVRVVECGGGLPVRSSALRIGQTQAWTGKVQVSLYKCAVAWENNLPVDIEILSAS